MLEIVLSHVVQPLIVGGVSIIIALLGVRKENKKSHEAINSGLRSLLRVEMYEMASNVKKRGWIHVEELENFNDMYEQYKVLGGNSIITGIHERLNDGKTYEIRYDSTQI